MLPTLVSPPHGTGPAPDQAAPPRRARRKTAGVTLVETMISMTLLATCMAGFIGTFLYSRRITEASVLHAAASSLMYGVVEQIKGFSYVDLLPSFAVDDEAPADVRDKPPYMRIRINQDITKWVRVVYTPKGTAPKAPTTCPDPAVKAAAVGAIDNFLGEIPLSTVTGTTSQDLAVNLWVWVEELKPDDPDVSEVKQVTVIYTYSFMDGGRERVVRNREVFLRTLYDK